MNKLKKKNRLQSCHSGDDKKLFTIKSVTHYPEKVKCAITTKELSDYQKLVIRRVYYMSHYRAEIVSGLKALQFCTYEVAVESLKEQELIDNEDYYGLMTEE